MPVGLLEEDLETIVCSDVVGVIDWECFYNVFGLSRHFPPQTFPHLLTLDSFSWSALFPHITSIVLADTSWLTPAVVEETLLRAWGGAV